MLHFIEKLINKERTLLKVPNGLKKPPIKEVKRKPIEIKPKLSPGRLAFETENKIETPERGDFLKAGQKIPFYKLYSIPKMAGLAVIALIIIIGFLYVIIPSSADCGFDKACFIEKADACESAEVRDIIADGTIVKYTTDNCVLTKEIEEFSDTEPEEVVSFFKGREMKCPYRENEFDPATIEGLSFGMENCEGNLKDAIIELRLAQLELGIS